MESVFAFGLLFGSLAFGILWILIVIEQKFPSIQGRRIFESLQTFAVGALIVCGLIVILALIGISASQPSAYEKCMKDAENMIDPQAIAWMEDYCASNK